MYLRNKRPSLINLSLINTPILRRTEMNWLFFALGAHCILCVQLLRERQ